MTLLRCIIFLLFAVSFVLGQSAQLSKQPRVAGDPAALVRNLYHVVIVRHPISFPEGADMKALAPYLSKALIRRLGTSLACAGDWSRQHPDPNLKPPYGWVDDGFFSGGNERASPGGFHVESVQPEKNGSFRVHVRLKYSEPIQNPYWYVDVIVTRENKHFVVDDVVFLKDDWDEESRLSEDLAVDCDGSRWVGHGDERKVE